MQAALAEGLRQMTCGMAPLGEARKIAAKNKKTAEQAGRFFEP
ncbi:hypothetical protein [Paraburkholderia fungorum]